MAKEPTTTTDPEMVIGDPVAKTLQQQAVDIAKQYGPIPALIVGSLWAGGSFVLEPHLERYIDKATDARFQGNEEKINMLQGEVIKIKDLMLERQLVIKEFMLNQDKILNAVKEIRDAGKKN